MLAKSTFWALLGLARICGCPWLQDMLACVAEMKMRGLGLASYIKDKTTEARESLKKVDWNPDKLRDNTFSSLKTWSTGCGPCWASRLVALVPGLSHSRQCMGMQLQCITCILTVSIMCASV